ncbi:MAG: hypothetical protein KUG69_06110 [Marinosulfonomonas sp.]|nr:hypothetical protein [Marinosulfonomonas sp.]
MKPSFALILSHEGIRLLRRASSGWRSVGEVSPEAPDLTKQLKYLRQTATDLSGGNFSTKLVLPNSQILYTRIEASGPTDKHREQEIRNGLEGLTPYQVDDLYFDWCDSGDGYVQVAVVARETLQEAEDFALKHRMNPVSLVATPDTSDFGKEAFFAATLYSHTLLSDGELVEPDQQIISEISQSESSDTPVVKDTDATEIVPPQAPAPNADETDQPELNDSSEQSTPDTDPADDSARDVASEPTFTTRRQSGDMQSDQEPLRLKWVAPRIAMTAPAEIAPADIVDDSAHDNIEAVPVTAPNLQAGENPKAFLAEPDDRVSDHRVSGKRAPTIPLAPDSAPRQPTDAQTAGQRKKEARALTIFGARNRSEAGGRTWRPGAPIVVGLAAALAVIAVGTAIFMGVPGTSAKFWRNDTATGPGLTAQAVVASSAFIDESAQTAAPHPDKAPATIEIASLDAPNISTDALLAPTHEEAIEAETAAPLTPLQAQEAFDISGIWQMAPRPPADLSTDRIDRVYVASIDRAVVSNDAVALPPYGAVNPDAPISAALPPPPPGMTFDLDERGFVRATRDGALTPDGIRVFAGKPAKTPFLRPGTPPQITEAPARSAELAALAKKRPILRPANLIEQYEKERFGGRSLAQVGKVRPKLRPASAQERGLVTTPSVATVVMSQSRVPIARPGNFQPAILKALAEASANPDVVVTSAATVTRVAPSIPTKASVATEATQKNAINLSAVNLIGVYGSSSERRALVRLKSGRYVKVQVGDRLDGGRVGAISATELLYTKGNRNLKLKLPTG